MKGSPDTAFIYMIGPTGGPHKIGHSMNVERRVKQLQRDAKGEIVITGKWPVGARIGLAAERYAHWLLREKHYRGEWFNVTLDEARSAVQHAIANAGSLDAYGLVPPIDSGDRLVFPERLVTLFPARTSERIDAIAGKNRRAEFIREAIERELARREKHPKPTS